MLDTNAHIASRARSTFMDAIHAAPSTRTPLILDVRVFWQVSGIALAAVALLGIAMSLFAGGAFINGFLEFDWTHNVVHVVLAALALVFGFGNIDVGVSKTTAKVVGIVYLLLGILGFVPPVVTMLGDVLALHLELGENLVHLVVGAWGVVTGFSR